MAPPPTLQDLIELAERDAETTAPLDQLAAAATTVAHLERVGDAVLSHFVDRARVSGHSWSEISGALGVTKQAAHKRFSLPAPAAPTLERFTLRARRVLEHAETNANALGHNYVGTEHLLLALFDEPEGIAAKVLVELCVRWSAGLQFPHVGPTPARNVRRRIGRGAKTRGHLDRGQRGAADAQVHPPAMRRDVAHRPRPLPRGRPAWVGSALENFTVPNRPVSGS